MSVCENDHCIIKWISIVLLWQKLLNKVVNTTTLCFALGGNSSSVPPGEYLVNGEGSTDEGCLGGPGGQTGHELIEFRLPGLTCVGTAMLGEARHSPGTHAESGSVRICFSLKFRHISIRGLPL